MRLALPKNVLMYDQPWEGNVRNQFLKPFAGKQKARLIRKPSGTSFANLRVYSISRSMFSNNSAGLRAARNS
ncbi:MAG: hypothetical protein WAO83_22505 [Fuerstiella sp.]